MSNVLINLACIGLFEVNICFFCIQCVFYYDVYYLQCMDMTWLGLGFWLCLILCFVCCPVINMDLSVPFEVELTWPLALLASVLYLPQKAIRILCLIALMLDTWCHGCKKGSPFKNIQTTSKIKPKPRSFFSMHSLTEI